MKFYQASRRFAVLWRIFMIVVMSFLYVFPVSAEANGIIMRSPDIGEEVTNLFRFEDFPVGNVSYRLEGPEGDIVAEGVVLNDDPFQLVITLADIPQYRPGTYTFIFEVGTTPVDPLKLAYRSNEKRLQSSSGLSTNSYVYSFGVDRSPKPKAYWRKW